MLGISRREVAKVLGVSDTAVRKALKAGRIKELSDGSIDLEEAKASWASHTDPARSKVRTAREPSANQGANLADEGANFADEVRTPPLPPVRTQEDAEEAVSLIVRVLAEEGVAAGAVDFEAARTAETILKARERELKMQEPRKVLVPLAKVKIHIERAFTGYKQAMQRLPSRHAAAIAAKLGNPAGLDAEMSAAIAAELTELA